MNDITSVDPRRRAERVPLHADIEVFGPTPANGVVLNASTGGLRVVLDQALYLEDHCHLRLTTGDERGHIAGARVRWVRALHDGWIVGLELESRRMP